MSDDVAAVPCVRSLFKMRCDGNPHNASTPPDGWHSECLAAAGYAVVKPPEGMAVAHGARLVALADEWCGRAVLGIEPPSEAP